MVAAVLALLGAWALAVSASLSSPHRPHHAHSHVHASPFPASTRHFGEHQPLRSRTRLYATLRAMSPSPVKLIIAGAPASGKGTQCAMITEKFGVVHLSTGDILRAAVKEGTELGAKAKSFMDAGQLVPDELITSVICDRLQQEDCVSKGWLLDGFPRTKSQADALSAAGMVPDAFVLLDVPEEVLVERVTGRRTDPETGRIYHLRFSPPESAEVSARLVQRSDDTAEKIVVRYREFQSHIDAVKEAYTENLICVDGTLSQSEVSSVVESAISDAVTAPKQVPATRICRISSNKLNIIIAGAPASGKGTQCAMITEKFGVVHLSTGDILRAAVKEGTELGAKAKSFMDAGQLVPDELITSVICDRLQQEDCVSKGWLLDGFPRTKSQADALSAAGMVPDAFVLLDVPEEVLVERVTGRRTDPETGRIYHLRFSPPESAEVRARLVQRSDDTAEKIVVRYREFQSHIDAVKDGYADKLVRVDGTLGQSEVSAVVLSALEGVKRDKLNDDDNDASLTAVGGPTKTTVQTIAQNFVGAVSLFAMDKVFAAAFKKHGINFPSSLAAMLSVFASLTAANAANPSIAAVAFDNVQPAVSLIKAWLPLLFVPPLVVLPLKLYLLAGYEAQMAQLVATGLVASTVSSGVFSEVLGRLLPAPVGKDDPVKTQPMPALPPLTGPMAMALLSLAISKGAPNAASKAMAIKPFGVASSVSSYLLAMRLSKQVRAVVHPVLVTAGLTYAALAGFAAFNGIGLKGLLLGYFGTGRGAGDMISSLLSTAIVSFGVQLFAYRSLLGRNAARVTLTTLLSAIFGLLSSAFLAGGIGFAEPATSFSTLTRCITTPLALSGAAFTGADPSLAAFIVVVTGILGASFGEKILSACKITDPVSVGLSMGASAHGLGTAALSYDPVKFAASVVSMTLTGVWTVALLVNEPFRNVLMKLAFKR